MTTQLKRLKALIVKMSFGVDVGNVVQVARAEAKKIFKNPNKIVVVDMIHRDYGWVVVVQNSQVVDERVT